MYTTYAKQYDSAARDNIYNALLERPSTIALLDVLKGSILSTLVAAQVYTHSGLSTKVPTKLRVPTCLKIWLI